MSSIVQRGFADYNDRHREEPIRVRMGLHAGEVTRGADDFFGKNVLLAARIVNEARGGQILVSSPLRELIDSTGGFRFDEGQEVELKGLSRPYRLLEVRG
jgi:class 3 adenylate cyclase